MGVRGLLFSYLDSYHVDLHQRRITNRLEAMNLPGLNDRFGLVTRHFFQQRADSPGARDASFAAPLRSAGVSPALLAGFDESCHYLVIRHSPLPHKTAGEYDGGASSPVRPYGEFFSG